MTKISYEKYRELLLDPATPDEVLDRYVIVEPVDGSLTLTLRPDPEQVEMTELEKDLEDGMRFANDFDRWRRQERFNRLIRNGVSKPILVAEGDSWFQFPVKIRDVIDHLSESYLIWCLSAAGDTLQNITDTSKPSPRHYEYLPALRALKAHVRGFLFSAAGNDIIGEMLQPDGSTGRALEGIVKNGGGASDPAAYVDATVLGQRLVSIEKGYRKVIADVRAEPGLEQLPIFVHGYDYVFPYPWGSEGNARSHIWSRPLGKWIGKALDAGAIQDQEMRRRVMIYLIDKLYDTLEAMAAGDANVHVVDCRGAMPSIGDWKDEIHGTNAGFAKVASRFSDRIYEVLGNPVA